MWGKVYAYILRVANLHGIEYQSVTRPPARFEDSTVLETTGTRQVLSSSEDYKINFYFLLSISTFQFLLSFKHCMKVVKTRT